MSCLKNLTVKLTRLLWLGLTQFCFETGVSPHSQTGYNVIVGWWSVTSQMFGFPIWASCFHAEVLVAHHLVCGPIWFHFGENQSGQFLHNSAAPTFQTFLMPASDVIPQFAPVSPGNDLFSSSSWRMDYSPEYFFRPDILLLILWSSKYWALRGRLFTLFDYDHDLSENESDRNYWEPFALPEVATAAR